MRPTQVLKFDKKISRYTKHTKIMMQLKKKIVEDQNEEKKTIIKNTKINNMQTGTETRVIKRNEPNKQEMKN